MRDHHTTRTLNEWLDTPAGIAKTAAYGSRQAAAYAEYEAEQADRAWRRQRAEERFERHPERFESPAHAMAGIPEPVGGGGATLYGSTDEIVAAFRSVEPLSGVRNLGPDPDLPADVIKGFAQRQGRPDEPLDLRPPWQRGES